jgi:4-carboxymuconolactone decarboxylase
MSEGPRIAFPAPGEMTPEQRAVHEKIGGLRGGHIPMPYRAALHRPELADKWQQIGELLRYRTALPVRLAEFAVLITARHFDCSYIWNAHEPLAVAAGLPQTTADALEAGHHPPSLAADERAIYDYCQELLATHFVSDAAYGPALALLETAGIVELTALLGYYVMVAMTLNAHQLSRPAGMISPPPTRSTNRIVE